jgi:hypothetical protein
VGLENTTKNIGGTKMNVVVIKPRSEKVIRIESDLTPDKIVSAASFDAECLVVRDENKQQVYGLGVTRNEGQGSIGKYGAVFVGTKPSEKIVQTFKISTSDDASFTAIVARTQEQLTVVETQINNTLAKLAEANKTIKEV